MELEKVLIHYENEPLKLKAAQFLIENMHGHFSYSNQTYVEKYYDAIDLVNLYAGSDNDELAGMYKTIVFKYSEPPSYIQDLQVISATYLIDNIDRAFENWQHGLWATHLDFEEFCEYLLPYKVAECQTLDNWREYFSDTVYGDLQYLSYNAHSSHSAYWSCYAVQQKLMKLDPKRYIDIPLRYPVRRMRSLMHTLLKKDCDDSSIANVSAMRARGIPVMIDFTPQWPNRGQRHSWCVLLENTGKNRRFQGLDNIENTYIGEPIAKVFRHCYAIDSELLELNQSEKIIPTLFRNLHIRDVTDEHQRTDDVTVNLDLQHGQYAYLSVFDNAHWRPVHFGKINGTKAVFKKMGRDVVYLPLCITEEQRNPVPVAPPFILTLRGEVIPVVPDMTQRQTLKLTRKYPTFRFSSWSADRVLGAKIQAANRANFSDAVTLHTIWKYGTEAGEILLDTVKNKYRYWRYYSAPNAQGNVAELKFFQQGQNITKQGKIIGSPNEDINYEKYRVFDDDPLTFFNSPELSDSWVGLDFGKAVSISRILYMPRSDGNIVTYGDEYELKYWNNGWISLGRKVADNIYLIFEDCPSDALFLLHDCTRGIQDRIFTYENDKQVWW
ncbi:MAG: discoidin domain-containing protein [Prevotellaceae bacterium]|nr:discoidin domain-containing protein [Prevotellaceae bacterium]